MRRRHLALALFPLATAAAFACAPSASEEEAESGSDALSRRGVEVIRPRPPLRTDAGRPPVKPVPPVAPIATLVAPGTKTCEPIRFDLRRVSRSCEDLPGASVEQGVTYVPGVGGRFKVQRLLAGTGAPQAVQEKTCSYSWESTSCALPDTEKLLVQEPHEQLAPRAPGCERLGPAGCMMKMPPLPAIDGGIPTGLGRCEVCGFAADKHLWAVLPPDWKSFSYWAGSERRYVEISSSQAVYDVGLASSVPAQDVTLYQYDSAPETQP